MRRERSSAWSWCRWERRTTSGRFHDAGSGRGARRRSNPAWGRSSGSVRIRTPSRSRTTEEWPSQVILMPGVARCGGVSGQAKRLGLEGIELGLGDGSGVEQRLGVGDLAGRVAGVPATCWMYSCWAACCCGNCLHLTLGHAAAPGDQVDERAEPGDEDQQDRPAGLAPAAEGAVAEQVEQAAEPHHQRRDPDEEPETPQQNVPEVYSKCPWLLLESCPPESDPSLSAKPSGMAEHLPGPDAALNGQPARTCGATHRP